MTPKLLRQLRRSMIVVVLAMLSAVGHSHPSEAWVEQFRVLTLWAEAVSHQDQETITAFTAETSAPFTGSPSAVVTTRHAIFSETDQVVD